ncbi:MAG: LytTR family DNA-binding domain-containing protein [Prolixibacteraceae bacterium]|jgi:two-component system response regulator LytT|nr:LytTR family DNA-binding domain-containing protein [Prolixibacteraceae bacterium]
MKAIIIEDEKRASNHLKSLIKEVEAEIEVIAELQTISQSVEWFRENLMPDVVFLDIHLADGSSFEIFKEISIESPIIFTTAYDEYALKAFEVNSVDYLLKPINKNDLKRALLKIKTLSRTHDSDLNNSKLIKSLLETLNREHAYKKALLVAYKDKLIPLATKEIAYFYTEYKIVKVVTFSDANYVIDDSLEKISQQLSLDDFFRINRQYIVSRNAIKDASVWFASRLALNLTVPTPERLYVSRSNVNEFKRWLSG